MHDRATCSYRTVDFGSRSKLGALPAAAFKIMPKASIASARPVSVSVSSER